MDGGLFDPHVSQAIILIFLAIVGIAITTFAPDEE